jgi:hypothetical protein
MSDFCHRNKKLEGKCLVKNGRFPLYVKKGKFKVGADPADGLGC